MTHWFSGSCVWIAVYSASLVHPAEATERDEGEMGMRRRETGGEMMWLTCDRMELLCWYKEKNTQTINLHTHTITVQIHTMMTDRNISHVFGHNPRKNTLNTSFSKQHGLISFHEQGTNEDKCISKPALVELNRSMRLVAN